MNFLSKEQVQQIAGTYETPLYVYSEEKLEQAAKMFLSFPSAFGHVVRYAMKANANRNILKMFQNMGLKIDASSEYEVYRALNLPSRNFYKIISNFGLG